MVRPRTPEIAADIVIELEDRPGRPIVVIRRANPPHGHALPGGFVDIGETVEHAAVREAREDKSQPLAQLLLPALNEVFDIGTSRVLAARQHTHGAIFAMLGLLLFISAFMAGFGQAKVSRQSMLHLLGFAAITTLALYLIVDLEFPRLGIIRVDEFDQALRELLDTLKP